MPRGSKRHSWRYWPVVATPSGVTAGALVFALAPVASAQVNTETMRARIHEGGASLLVQGTLDGHTGNTSGLTADGGTKLSTSVTFAGHYDSRPPPGVLPVDT